MITPYAREWFSSFFNLTAVILYTLMGLIGQSKETILALLIYTFMGLVVKFGHWPAFIAAMVLSIPGANIFL